MAATNDGWRPHCSADSALDKLKGETALRDFTIASDSGKEWKVHKLVLYMHSDVLYRMATSPEFIECQSGRAVLKDAEDRCIEAMIRYLYTTDVEKLDRVPDVDGDGRNLTTPDIKHSTTYYAGIWILADMYNIQDLKLEVVGHFARWLQLCYNWELDINVVFRIIDVMDELGWMPSGIEKAATQFLADQIDGIHHHDPVNVEVLLDKHPDLAKDVLKLMMKSNYRKPDDKHSPSWREAGW